MGLFGSSGCTAHHWEVGHTRNDYRVRWKNYNYRVERMAYYKCAHDGCRESKKDWHEVAAISVGEVDGEWADDRMEGLSEVLAYLQSVGDQ